MADADDPIIEPVITEPEPDPTPEPEPPAPEPEPEPEGDPAPTPPERTPSRRESLRIQQLISKLKAQEGGGRPPTDPPRPGVNYADELNADPDTIKRFETDRQEYGRQLYEQGMRQVESMQFQTRLEIDAPRVENEHPQLNPRNKEQFNPVLADTINRWYLASVGYDEKTGMVQNSRVRYSEFVDSIFELGDEIAGQKTAKTTENIARQVAQTGLRPDGSSPKRLNLSKEPQDMTDEELTAVINQAIPPRRNTRGQFTT